MGIWKASKEIVVLTGNLDPLSHVGSIYMHRGVDLFIMTWRGKDEWESKWFVEDDRIKFEFIKSPQGTVINWGDGKKLKRFIPSRHIKIVEDIARNKGKRLFDMELFW
jgi:hypothetical protein